MNINNFDTSSSGINLELSVFLDIDRAEWTFNDFFEVIQYASYSEDSVLFYHGGYDSLAYTGNLSDYYHLDDGMTAKELFLVYLEYIQALPGTIDVRCEVKQAQDYYNKPLRLWTLEYMEDYIRQQLYEESDMVHFMKASGCYSSTLSEYRVTGYSQGDLSTVYVPLKLDHPELDMCEFFRRRIFYAPVTCHLTIDDREYHLSEHVPDEYAFYDKDEYLAAAKNVLSREYSQEKLAYILEWLDESLPNSI